MLAPVDDAACSPAMASPHPTRPAHARHAVTAGALDDGSLAADAPLSAAYAYCQRITREIARTFYYGSLFLPAEKRRAAWALYAFCRIADDIADECDLYPDPLANLRHWRHALLDAYAGRPRGPVMRAWADTLTRYPIPPQPALELLRGVEMDIAGASFATFDDLRLYCYRVAGTVGLLMAPVLGYRDESAETTQAALAAAVDLGIAMQLTNILRDLAEDAARGRVYLPTDELSAFGYARADLERGAITPAFFQLMRYQIARAEQYYARGLRGVRLLDPDARLAIALSGSLYRAILRGIARRPQDVFTRRVHLSAPAKLALLPGAWARTRLGALE
ncbi:MAG TPA: squalene/phytoene synthase family protein [Ktedonobacterales bacterium]|nr:squalene/phytoene synthase family protein [Ktedonobacterales bacterium]